MFLTYSAAHILLFKFKKKISLFQVKFWWGKKKQKTKTILPAPNPPTLRTKISTHQIVPSTSSHILYSFPAVFFLNEILLPRKCQDHPSNLGCNMHYSIFMKCNDVQKLNPKRIFLKHKCEQYHTDAKLNQRIQYAKLKK